MKQVLVAAMAAGVVMLFGAAGAMAQAEPVERSAPAIILGPPPAERVTETPVAPPPADSVIETPANPPPIARKKPARPKAAPPPRQAAPAKAPPRKSPAKKAPAKKAPVRAATPPPQQAKTCDYCYGCESAIPTCRREWVCGKRYTDRLAAGLCRR